MMKIGKNILFALIGISFALSGCQGWCSISPSTCGPTDFDGPKREQKIYTVKWSPDGKKLAFIYQNGYTSNFNFSLYTVMIDGTHLQKLLETNTKNLIYRLYQWSSKELLIGDDRSLYDVDAQGAQKTIFNHAEKKVNGYYYQIQNACHLSDANYVVIQSSLYFPDWLDILNIETGSISSIKVEKPYPFLNVQSSAKVECLRFGNMLYLSQGYSLADENKSVAYYTVGKLMPQVGEIRDVTVFEFITKNISQIKDGPYFKFLGTDDKNNLFYALNQKESVQSVYSYNIQSKEKQEHQDIKVMGEFSPDFQKVAFLDYDAETKENNLAISNPDGSQKRIIVRIQDLPKGTLPK